MSSDALPPQRRGPQGGPGGGSGGRGANLTPAQGALEASKRLNLPCFHAGQILPGMVGCVACQFQIRNRGPLPTCPQCGDMVWAWLDEGDPPAPEEENSEQREAREAAAKAEAPEVEEGVKLDAPAKVEENVKLDP